MTQIILTSRMQLCSFGLFLNLVVSSPYHKFMILFMRVLWQALRITNGSSPAPATASTRPARHQPFHSNLPQHPLCLCVFCPVIAGGNLHTHPCSCSYSPYSSYCPNSSLFQLAYEQTKCLITLTQKSLIL